MHYFVTSKNVKWCHLIWPTLYNLPKCQINRLQQIQNCFARTVVKFVRPIIITDLCLQCLIVLITYTLLHCTADMLLSAYFWRKNFSTATTPNF